MSKSDLRFIYDGKCPFCNHYAELIELKSHLKGISVIDGRKNKELIMEMLEKGFDLDKGAILITEDKIFHGSEAINYISKRINSPSDNLLRILSSTFKSKTRCDFLFPFLVTARRFALIAKGESTSLV